jgi:hypothetical protein
VNAEVDGLHVKRIGIEGLVGYVYIVRVDLYWNLKISNICYNKLEF